MRIYTKRTLLIVLFFLLMLRISAQEAPPRTLADRIISFPDKVFSKIDQQANNFEHKLNKQTEKYLTQLERKEQKLKRKLWKKDSTKAKEVFGDVTERYAQLRNTLHNPAQAVQQHSNVYNAHLDSVNTALQFISNNQFFKQGETVAGNLGSSVQNVAELKNKLQATDYIRKQLQQRQQQLKGQLQNTGLAKEFKQFRKKIFYYQQQAREWQTAASDPKQLGTKLLATASKLPAFQNFFRQNSELASLFQLPGNSPLPGGAGGGSLAGLQTRADVQQQLMNQFGVQTFTAPAGGGTSPFQQQIQAAQGEMQKLKDKISQVSPFGGSGEEEMPDFKTNSQRTKTFLKRIEWGTNMQTTKGNYYFLVTSDIGLSAGFKLNDKSIIGVGASYKLGFGQNWENIRFTHQGAGLRTFIDYKIKGGFWLSGGGEMNYRAEIRRIDVLKEYSAWNHSALLGISKVIDVKSRFFKKTKLQLLYDFFWKQQPLQKQAVLFRVGYNL